MQQKLETKFAELFGTTGSVYTSPGRINLIGEHTDYNGGFVLPGAIDKAMFAMIKPNGTDRIKAYALDLDEYSEFGMTEEDKPTEGWAKYIFGVVREMDKRGYKAGGFDTVFYGNVPLGGGLSSSAALESTFGFALNDLFNLGIDKFELAKIGQMTEHNYVGVKCGIMDQFASLFGKEGHLIKLDCRSLEYEYVPFNPEGYKLVLVDSCVKHELASSAYNKRRESCERAVKVLQGPFPQISDLRDASDKMLMDVAGSLSEEDFLRAKYVIGEVWRLRDACEALNLGDYERVGARMYETHAGMSKLYEVSCEELDYLNDIAKECGVTGSRVMGGGFGGCTINLVKDELYEPFLQKVQTAYTDKFGTEVKIYDVVISDGARKLS